MRFRLPFSGTITPRGGSPTAFSNSTWRINTVTLNRFVFDDVNGSPQNANTQLDNVSVNTSAPVPEPSRIALSIFAVGAGLIAKRIRRRAI